MNRHILLTGSSGFIGKTLLEILMSSDTKLSVIVRNHNSRLPKKLNQIEVSDLGDSNDFSEVLCNVDTIIHAAARAHILNDIVDNPWSEFLKINTYATLNLAKQAAEAGVKRFIFISSVKVNGEMTELKKPFTPDAQFVPEDHYGLSKYEAEQGLLALTKETGMEVVIIRPPLVYGPGVRANFASMMKWVNKRVPLPFGAIHNKRSLVAIENLASFIIHCIDHPKAANEIFLISDGEDVSTTELLRKIAKAYGRKHAWLIPVPVSWMIFVARLAGKNAMATRLFGSLQIDSSKARNLLGWKPVITMDEQLKKTANAYLNKSCD